MTLITIEVKDENMTVHEGVEMPKSRLEWIADGLRVYVKGAMNGLQYSQAANLAMNYAEGINIPASRMKRANYRAPVKRPIDTKSGRMF